MNTNSFERAVLASVIGAVLALGVGAPQVARAQDGAQAAQEDTEQARAERRAARREAREARQAEQGNAGQGNAGQGNAGQGEAARAEAAAPVVAPPQGGGAREWARQRQDDDAMRQAQQQRAQEAMAAEQQRRDVQQRELQLQELARAQQQQRVQQQLAEQQRAEQQRAELQQRAEQQRIEQQQRMVQGRPDPRAQAEADAGQVGGRRTWNRERDDAGQGEHLRDVRERDARLAELRERQRQADGATVGQAAGDPAYPRDAQPAPYGRRIGDQDAARLRDGERGRERLSRARQDELIAQQRQQATQYNRYLGAQEAIARQRTESLQRQNRRSQYAYQQRYWDLLRQQRNRYGNNYYQSYNYYNDPYFYTAPTYRYYRGGNYYPINDYGADLLRQAINYGYREGIRAGRADRMDGWRFDYRGSFAYEDANYGYRGFYVSRAEYNYYFRQGFRRGYEDGYYGRRQYGRYYNGNDAILSTVLSLILNLQPYDRYRY
jgi:hypothetical protein